MVLLVVVCMFTLFTNAKGISKIIAPKCKRDYSRIIALAFIIALAVSILHR